MTSQGRCRSKAWPSPSLSLLIIDFIVIGVLGVIGVISVAITHGNAIATSAPALAPLLLFLFLPRLLSISRLLTLLPLLLVLLLTTQQLLY